MAWTKVTDIAYGRLKSPDLDVAEEFLTRFGMHRAERTANALYMRGTDPAHPPRFELHPAWKLAATGSWRLRRRRGVGHGCG